MNRMNREEAEKLAASFDEHDFSEEIENAELVDQPVTEPVIIVSLRLPKPVMDQVREAAKARGIRSTALVREWVEERLAQNTDIGEITIPASALPALVAEQSARKRAS
jgi:CopG antitoxin of type II toxin-antitoxin system